VLVAGCVNGLVLNQWLRPRGSRGHPSGRPGGARMESLAQWHRHRHPGDTRKHQMPALWATEPSSGGSVALFEGHQRWCGHRGHPSQTGCRHTGKVARCARGRRCGQLDVEHAPFQGDFGSFSRVGANGIQRVRQASEPNQEELVACVLLQRLFGFGFGHVLPLTRIHAEQDCQFVQPGRGHDLGRIERLLTSAKRHGLRMRVAR
jgi:hypothetical protein